MTTALAKRKPPDEHLAYSIDGQEAPNPLKFVPVPVRAALSEFWMCYSRLLPSIISVAALLRSWRRQGGITDKQIIEILDKLTRAERVAEFKWASELQVALAGEVSRCIHANRVQREMLARRRGIENAPTIPKEFSFQESFKKVIEEARAGQAATDKGK